MGILIMLDPPTAPMRLEAAQASAYHSGGWQRDYPRVQMLTIDELLSGQAPDMPPPHQTFSKSARIESASHKQPIMSGLFEE